MDALGSVSSSPTSLSLFKNGGNTSSLRTPLRGGRRREERRWTVHSKCCSTGSACPVAIGHRDSIQQEMLKERLSDLLGELCLFASAVTKFQKSCEHTVSVQLRASDVNVGFENFLQHFCLSHLGQSKCERKQQLITSFLPSFSIASMEHQVLCECCQCSVPNSSDELILVPHCPQRW